MTVKPVFKKVPLPNPSARSPLKTKWAPTFERLKLQWVQIAQDLGARQAHNLGYQLRKHFPGYEIVARSYEENVYGIWARKEEE